MIPLLSIKRYLPVKLKRNPGSILGRLLWNKETFRPWWEKQQSDICDVECLICNMNSYEYFPQSYNVRHTIVFHFYIYIRNWKNKLNVDTFHIYHCVFTRWFFCDEIINLFLLWQNGIYEIASPYSFTINLIQSQLFHF